MKKYLSMFLMLILTLMLTSCIESTPTPKPIENDPSKEKVIQDLDIDVTMHEFFTKINPISELQESYIYIGYWPQRELLDTDTLAAVEKIEETNERGYIEYKGMEFLKFTVVNNHIHAEDDQKGDGTFEYATGYVPGTTHYFLVEPLCWKLMHANTAAGEYMLITENIIDANSFYVGPNKREIDGKEIYPHNYEYSDIRNWLNNDFFELCFTKEEQEMILEVVNSNKCLFQYTQTEYVNNPTTDKVWLLSYQQVTSTLYGFKGNGICDVSRQASPTNYANARGLILHSIDGIDSSIWALRNAYELAPLHCAYVGYDGLGAKAFYTDAQNVGTRPAIQITLPTNSEE